jgi:hypothetical protein
MSEEHIFVVLTEAVPGREEEFHDWYDNVHLADVTSVDGFTKARRYQLSDAQLEGYGHDATHQNLALYWVEGDAGEAFANLAAGIQDGSVPLSDAMDETKTVCWNYTARDGS